MIPSSYFDVMTIKKNFSVGIFCAHDDHDFPTGLQEIMELFITKMIIILLWSGDAIYILALIIHNINKSLYCNDTGSLNFLAPVFCSVQSASVTKGGGGGAQGAMAPCW